MSDWTYIHGTILVDPLARTQPEGQYIIDTVLAHLPVISGSEEDMYTHVVRSQRYDSWQGTDEFGEFTNNLFDNYGKKSLKNGGIKMQTHYIIVVEGYLRDRCFDDIYKRFIKWLCRLSKRLCVENVLVNIRDYYKQTTIIDARGVYEAMYEYPLCCLGNEDGEPSWTDYLRWERTKNSEYPLMLEYKYYKNDDTDKEIECRLKYKKTIRDE